MEQLTSPRQQSQGCLDRACLRVFSASCSFLTGAGTIATILLALWQCYIGVADWSLWNFCLWPDYLCVAGLTVLNILPLTTTCVALMTRCIAWCSVPNTWVWMHACRWLVVNPIGLQGCNTDDTALLVPCCWIPLVTEAVSSNTRIIHLDAQQVSARCCSQMFCRVF